MKATSKSTKPKAHAPAKAARQKDGTSDDERVGATCTEIYLIWDACASIRTLLKGAHHFEVEMNGGRVNVGIAVDAMARSIDLACDRLHALHVEPDAAIAPREEASHG